MKRNGVGNKKVNEVILFMCIGLGVGAVISLLLDEIIYMLIGEGIGAVIGLFLKFIISFLGKQKNVE